MLFPVVLFAFFVGLLLLPFLGFVRGKTARRILLAAALVLLNIGGLAWSFAVYAVSRLDGSQPPGLLALIAGGLWLPLLVWVMVNVGAVVLYRWGNVRAH